MAELFVSGSESDQGFHRELAENATVRLGRAPAEGWAVPWDQRISREHADLVWTDGALEVTCLENARNPIVFGGRQLRKARFRAGERFRIGRTKFELVVDQVPQGESNVLAERAYKHDDLEKYAFRDATQQMQLLGQLPGILDSCQTDEDVAARLVELLIEAIPDAEAVAVTQYDLPTANGTSGGGNGHDVEADLSTLANSLESGGSLEGSTLWLDRPRMMRVATREDYTARFRPSRRLALSALLRRETVVHIWGGDESNANFTLSENLNWAFCVPIHGESSAGWCLYVAGSGDSSEAAIGGDLRFAELMAQLLGSIRQVRALQTKTTQLSQFFSPSLVKSLDSDEALEPREGDVGILFCDVRGFSRLSEQNRHDLKDLLHRISCALTLMTRAIHQNDGAIADFQGDAALGFWGWPIAEPGDPVRACRCALQILRDFAMASATSGGPLEGFRVGVGVTYGRAVAGKIGTPEQSQITVLGHVVNLGARLEGLTKKFGVKVLLDQATAAAVQDELKPSEGFTRRLGIVRPAGMESAVEVHELVPASMLGTAYSDRSLADHRMAVDAFIAGDWNDAFTLFESLPASDRTSQLLMAHMARYDYTAPADWNGVLVFDSK